MKTQRILIILAVTSVINLCYANAQTLTPIATPTLPTQQIAPIDLTQGIMAAGDRLSQQYAEKEEMTDANIYIFLKESGYDVMPYNSPNRVDGFNFIMDRSLQITTIYLLKQSNAVVIHETFNKENNVTGKIDHIDFRMVGDSKVYSMVNKTKQLFNDILIDYESSNGQVNIKMIMPSKTMYDFKMHFRDYLITIKKAKDYFKKLVLEDFENTYN